MENLSFELMLHITYYLNAHDVLSLSTVCRMAREACLVRLDPERHLQRSFRHTDLLLAAMTDYGCVLSGSRALEYFVPGSMANNESDSDWDFLVPCLQRSVIGMMEVLRACGVVWDHPLTGLLSLPEALVGAVAYVHTSVLRRIGPEELENDPILQPSKRALKLYENVYENWLRSMKMNPYGPYVEEYKIEKISAAASGYTIAEASCCTFLPPLSTNGNGLRPSTGSETVDEMNGGGLVRQYKHDFIDRKISLISGQIGKRTRVQLIHCHNGNEFVGTPLEYILNVYYASHVQCFLSGWGAGHFFYDLTKDRRALVWDVDSRAKLQSVDKCIAKYNKRGYRFFSAKNPVIECHGTLAQHRDDAQQSSSRESSDNVSELSATSLTSATTTATTTTAIDATLPPLRNARLGDPGTLYIPFVRLQNRLVDYADRYRAEDDDLPTGFAVQTYFQHLHKSIADLRFHRTSSSNWCNPLNYSYETVPLEPMTPQLDPYRDSSELSLDWYVNVDCLYDQGTHGFSVLCLMAASAPEKAKTLLEDLERLCHGEGGLGEHLILLMALTSTTCYMWRPWEGMRHKKQKYFNSPPQI